MRACFRGVHDWDVVFILSKTRHTHDMDVAADVEVRRASEAVCDDPVWFRIWFQSHCDRDFQGHDIFMSCICRAQQAKNTTWTRHSMSYRHKRAANHHT